MKVFVSLLAAALMLASCGNNSGNAAKSADGKADTSAVKDGPEDSRGYIVKVGDTVPDFDLRFADGSTVNIRELRGKVVMLQFTASWCGVCRKEMPYIESRIWQPLKDNPEFALFGIDFKESAQKTADFAESVPVTYPLTLDEEGETFALFCEKGAGVTRNIIIDREGRIIMLTRLFDEEEFGSMVETINRELGK